MPHILIKQTPDTSITAPVGPSPSIKLFSNSNDGGILYYMDSSGVPLPVGAGGATYNPIVPITYSSLYSLYTGGQFATGSFYLITDFETVYVQPDFYCDGTLKTTPTVKSKPSGWGYQPILVQAISNCSLSPNAYQPKPSGPLGSYNGFEKDTIKYDISWNKTEFMNNAKGRITERIDEFGNRTDFDHKTVYFRRYQEYSRNSLQSGSIQSYDCITGTVSGSGTSFTSFSVGDILLVDSESVLNYNVGFKVKSVISNTLMTVEVDSAYVGGIPYGGTLTLYNGMTVITPVDYSFSSQSFDFYSSSAIGRYNQYKEMYFGQGDASDYDEYLTFDIGSYNNYLSNYSQQYISGSVNNTLVLSNNILSTAVKNNFTGLFYNNTLNSCASNLISGDFFNNTTDEFVLNIILNTFSNNSLYKVKRCKFNCEFNFNYSNTNIYDNDFQAPVTYVDFSSSTHVPSTYNCTIFSNSSSFLRLSYYDGADVLNIVNVDA